MLVQNGPAGPVSRCPLIEVDRKQPAGRKAGHACRRPIGDLDR
jgi:hypothetical protein